MIRRIRVYSQKAIRPLAGQPRRLGGNDG